MKKIKRLTVVMFVLLIITATLSGCGDKSNAEENMYDNSENIAKLIDDVEVIEDSLVYYKDTKVVYIMITLDSDYDDETVSYFAPYISENGKYCRYIDGNIVEIE